MRPFSIRCAGRARVAACLALVVAAQLLAGCAHAVRSAPGDPVADAVQSLASGGVAVMDDFRSTTPATALTGTPSALRFTRWQVRNLVNEAGAHAGYLGTELDGLAAPAAGAPPLTMLINAWLTRKDGALATYAAGVMGTFDPKHPDATVYPTIVVLTFIGDIARPAETSQLPHPRFEYERLFAAPADAQDGVCTDIAAWVGNQVNSITAAIQSNGSGWLSSLWNTVVSVGGTVVSAVFSAISGTVVGFITQVATVCGVIMQVASMFKPWSVQVAGTPVTMQRTGTPADGTFVATLTAGDVPWPSQLISCVDALTGGSVKLNDASYKDAPVTWTPKSNIPGLATATSSDATLLKNKTAAYNFQTTTVQDVPANECPRTVPAGNLVVEVSVARSDITKALTSLESLIANQINAVIRPYLAPYILATLSDANEKAQTFGAPHQSASIALTEEVADPLCPQTPPPATTAEPTTAAGPAASLPDLPCSQLLTAGDTAPLGGGAVFVPTDEHGNKIDVGAMMQALVTGTLFNAPNGQSLTHVSHARPDPDYDQTRSSYCVIGIAPDKMFAFFDEAPKGSANDHKDQDTNDALHACRAVIGQALLDHFGADCRNESNSTTSTVTIYGPTAEYILTLFPQGTVTTQSAYAMFRNLLRRLS